MIATQNMRLTIIKKEQVIIELSKTICDVSVFPGIGDTITYCIEVCNVRDPSLGLEFGADNIEVEESWPSDLSYIDYTSSSGTFIYGAPLGTWQIPTIASGDCELLEIRAEILNDGMIENIAQVTSYDGETDVDSGANNDDGGKPRG